MALNDINVRQNEDEHLERLAAQRALYSQAKCVRLFVVVSAISIAVASALAAFLYPKASPGLGLLGLLLALLDLLFLDGREEDLRQRAAAIQEDFDTRLFSLPWRDSLGHEVEHERVVEEGRDGKSDPKLRDWYPDVSALPPGLAALVCQRSSITWDGRTRSIYSVVVGVMTVVFAVSMVGLAVAMEMALADFLMALAFPAFPAVQHGVKVVRAHRKAADAEKALFDDVEALVRQGPSAVDVTALRQVQDRLWLLRREQPLVPDALYRLTRERREVIMREATARIVAEVQRLKQRPRSTSRR